MAVVRVNRQRSRPTMARLAVPPTWSRYSTYPSDGLTPERLTAILREADDGDPARQMELFEEIEGKDPHIASQLQTRKNAVTGLSWEVIPWSDDPADKDAAELVGDILSGIRDWDGLLLDLLDAIGKGIAVSEIIWGYDGGRVIPREVVRVPQTLLRWDEEDRLRIITQEEVLGILPEPNKYITHVYKARSGHPSKGGVLRVCAWMYLFKNYSLKDWVSFAEIYGMPLRLGKYGASASEDDKRALARALIQLGSDAAGIIPDTAAIEFIEANKTSSASVYQLLAEYCDSQTSKAIVGQTLTADSGGGSYAQSKTHNDVRHDLTEADCRALATTLRDDLIRPLMLYNLGREDRLPTIHFACEVPEDLAALANILKSLVDIGTPIPLPYIYSKFGIPEPQPGEATTQRPTASPLLLSDRVRQIAAKDDAPKAAAAAVQTKIDQLTEYAAAKGGSRLARAWGPLRQLLETSGNLEEALAMIDNPSRAVELLGQMEDPQLRELLADAMLLADLTGREREHG